MKSDDGSGTVLAICLSQDPESKSEDMLSMKNEADTKSQGIDILSPDLSNMESHQQKNHTESTFSISSEDENIREDVPSSKEYLKSLIERLGNESGYLISQPYQRFDS